MNVRTKNKIIMYTAVNSDVMSTTSTQYLLYASLVLGSIGTYNALKDGMAPPGAVSNGGGNLKLEDDIADLSGSMRAVESFLESFNNNSTSLHAELADVHSTLNTLTSFESSRDSSAVDVDSTYVKNLSKRLTLMETSNTSSKEAAFHARDTSERNKSTLESLKSLVDSVTQQISTTRVSSGQVAQLAEQVTGETLDFTAMESRVNGLTRESEALATRLVGVETWVQGRKSASQNVTADSGSAAVSQATLDNITDLQGAVDLNTGNIFTLRTDVDINTDDISTLGTDLQEQISQNKSDTSAVKLIADGTVSDIDNLHLPRISDLESKVLGLTDTDTTTGTRLDLVEAEVPLAQAARGILSDDLVSLSERVTNNTNSIGDIEDDLDGVIQEDIDAAKARITALEGDANHLSQKLTRSGDDILCNGLLRANHGAQISLNKQWLRLLASNNSAYMMYVNHGQANEGPSGAAPAKGHGFDKNAVRIRTEKHVDAGFIVENHNEEMLLSVRGSDGLTACAGPLTVQNKASISSADGSNAFFSHANFSSSNVDFALAHISNGKTILSSNGAGASGIIQCRVRGTDMLQIQPTQVEVERELKINHPSGTHDTHFRADSNYISTGAGKKTFFRFGGGAPSVTIRDKEVNINGTDVLVKLNSLQSQVDAIKKDYVKKGSEYYINGHKDSWKAELGYDGNDARWSKSNTRMKIKIV